ncbi:class I SAM-dependent methyltransferase [Streptomyces sp. ME19-03-3]|nr:class I SAM-dependent methyltransferase [Streptomyces sp. ME19-03-3]
MSAVPGGPDPALAGRTTRTAAPWNTRTVVAWPAGSDVQPRPAVRPDPVLPGEPWTDDPYAHAIRTGRGPLFLRRLAPASPPAGGGADGELLPLDIERWCAAPDTADTAVLDRCAGAVLDVGCGPGRLVASLAAGGVRALGVDVSPAAVARTRQRGGSAVRRSVFDRLPGEGRWDTVLLMDGNVGIGGDPFALLTRLCALTAPGGRLLAEAAPHDADERLVVRVEDGQGRHGRPFPWARLGVTVLLRTAEDAGWVTAGRWSAAGRSFVELRRPRPGHGDGASTATGRPPRR